MACISILQIRANEKKKIPGIDFKPKASYVGVLKERKKERNKETEKQRKKERKKERKKQTNKETKKLGEI